MKTFLTIVIGGLAVVIGVVVIICDSQQSGIGPSEYIMPSKPLKAFVLGGTGTTGKAIVKALMEHPDFEKIGIIGRRNLQLPSLAEDPRYSKFEQILIDFENPSSYATVFEGYDVGFCALGIASGGLSNEAYYRITHDYVVDTAKLAKAGGCQHFHFVSGGMTSKTSMFYWARTKAEVEEKISQMGFERVSIYRPGGIVKDKNEVHTKAESAGICAYRILDPFQLISIDSLQLGKVIVNNTFRVPENNPETLENCAIQKLGKEFK